MKHDRSPLDSQQRHRGWPLNRDILCWIGAIALILLFFGADQLFVSRLPKTNAIEYHNSLPQRLDLPATQALASANHAQRQ